jgi:hypothetical protein
VKKGKVVKLDRVIPERYDDALHFCEEFSNLLETSGVSDINLHNVDEIRLSMDRGRSLHADVIAGHDRTTANVALGVDSTTLTALPVVSARGECLCVYLILRKPGDTRSAPSSSEEEPHSEADEVEVNVVLDVPQSGRLLRSDKRSWSYFYLVTSTGMIDSDTFRVIMLHWAGLWSTRYPGLYAYVVMDRLPAHLNPSTVMELARRRVFSYFFNGQASHYIQPLDGQVFARLKQVFRGQVLSYAIDAARAGTRCDAVFNATYDALAAALQPKIIQKSFADRGIWPWDPEIILANAAKWHLAAGAEVDEGLSTIVDNICDAAVQKSRARVQRTAENRTPSRVKPGSAAPESHDELLASARRKEAAKEEEARKKNQRRLEFQQNREKRDAEKAERAARFAARRQAAQEKREELERKREGLKCRGLCGRKTRKDGKWDCCPCELFRMCPTCMEEDSCRNAFKKHLHQCCAPRQRRRAASSGQSAAVVLHKRTREDEEAPPRYKRRARERSACIECDSSPCACSS